jgi:transcriptional regulator with XRE-family HTH domain
MDIHELAKRNLVHLKKGVRKPRFRNPTKKKVKNRILMAFLYGTNTKISELANKVGVSGRTAHSWIYERNPSEENRRKIADALGISEDILFFEHCGEEEIVVPFKTTLHLGFLGERIKNVMLAGLMVVHKINHPDLAEYLGYNRSLFRSHIHDGRIPPIEIQDKVSQFFRIPPHIIYNPEHFIEVSFTAKDFWPYYSKSKFKGVE